MGPDTGSRLRVPGSRSCPSAGFGDIKPQGDIWEEQGLSQVPTWAVSWCGVPCGYRRAGGGTWGIVTFGDTRGVAVAPAQP